MGLSLMNMLGFSSSVYFANKHVIENSSLQSQSYITSDGQLASLSWNKAPIWGLRPDLYYLCDSYGLVLVGRPLWREDGSVVCHCYWSWPAQSILGPIPVGLLAIFYCLDSSLKVTVLSMWGALSHERSGLSFVSHSRYNLYNYLQFYC
jgi:hypothetical protein